MVVVILTNGAENDIVMANDEPFRINDDILNHFMEKELPEMANRPKLFIIQKCHNKDDVNSNHCGGDTVVDYFDDYSICTCIYEEEKDHLCKGCMYKKLLKTSSSANHHLDHRDFCIVNSSFNGTGLSFIKSFCDVLQTIDLKKNHLLDVLTVTNNLIGGVIMKSSLTHKLFLK